MRIRLRSPGERRASARAAALALTAIACSGAEPVLEPVDIGTFSFTVEDRGGETRLFDGPAVAFQNSGDPEHPGPRDEFRLDLDTVHAYAEPVGDWALAFTIRRAVVVGRRPLTPPRSPDAPYVGALLFTPTSGSWRAVAGWLTVTRRTPAAVVATFALEVERVDRFAPGETLRVSGAVRAPRRTF